MNWLTKNVRRLMEDTLLYKCSLIIMGFLYVFPATTQTAQSVLKWTIPWGLVIITYDLIKKRDCLQRKGYWFIYAFVFLAGISVLVNYQNKLIRNIIYIIYVFISVCIPLVVSKKKEKDQVLKEIKVICTLMTVLTMGVALLSLLIYVTNYQGAITANGAEYILGFVEGRLYGIMGNPNSSAHIAFFSMMFSLLSIGLFPKRKIHVVHYMNLVLQFMVFSLTNSRSALVCMSVAIAIYLFIGTKRRIGKKVFTSFALACIVAVLGIGCFYGGVQLSNKLASALPPAYSFVRHRVLYPEMHDFNKEDATIETGATENKKVMESVESVEPEEILPDKSEFNMIDTDREYKTDDISNGRMDIWRAGWHTAKENILFGVGSESVQQMVTPYLSEEFMNSSPNMASNMHNIYLQILVGNGILALVCFLGFFACVLLKTIHYICKLESHDEKMAHIVCVLLCSIVGMLVENFFDSNIIGFMSFFIVPVFWTLCGYLMALVDQAEERRKGDYNCEKILFLIDTLGGGGAEKVLVTLANGLSEKYDITVQTLFDDGIYRENLCDKVRYNPGFSWSGKNFRRIMQRVMKYLPARVLHEWLIADGYDCEIAFLEGATTKIISGGTPSVRRIAWVHTDLLSFPGSIGAFYPTRKILSQAYHAYDIVGCVSQQAKDALLQVVPGLSKVKVVYNPVNATEIEAKSKEPGAQEWIKQCFTFCAVGRMVDQKGFDRLLDAAERLKQDGKNFEVLIFGTGMRENELRAQAKRLGLEDVVQFMGYSSCVEYYVKQADVYICSSRVEGFSLTVAEALILGVPVVSTECTGPIELLAGGKYGILTENSTEGIYNGMKQIFENPELLEEFRQKSVERRKFFDLQKTYDQVCTMIDG